MFGQETESTAQLMSAQTIILACPICTYNIIDPTWFYFAAARIAVICYAADRRMSLLRILGLFCAYEAVYYYLVHLAIWYAHPAVSESMAITVATASLIVLTLGLPAVGVFKLASRFNFFRGTSPMPTTWGRAFLLVPMLIAVAILETVIINSGGWHIRYMNSTTNTRVNKTDAGNGSYGICRGTDGSQRPPALPFGLPSASYVAPLHSRSLSPDPRR